MGKRIPSGDLSGRTLGPFEIGERLGSGGMGHVYRAWDTRLDRCVALKTLRRRWRDQVQSIERLRREGKALAQIRSPFVVKVHELAYASEADLHFLVMEYVEGRSLEQILECEGRLAPLDALAVVTQIAHGLAAVHRQGNLVHRDVKPGNIMICGVSPLAEARAVLIDFSLALLRDAQRLTLDGVGVGTPGYSAPEQAHGLEIDGRADIFSLGITCHELVHGHLPGEAAEPSVTAPGGLDELIAWMTRDDPAQRPQEIEELIERLATLRLPDAAPCSLVATHPRGSEDALRRLAPRAASEEPLGLEKQARELWQSGQRAAALALLDPLPEASRAERARLSQLRAGWLLVEAEHASADLRQGLVESAVSAFKRVPPADRDWAQYALALQGKGVGLLGAGRAVLAMRSLEAALGAHERAASAGAWNARGDTLLALGEACLAADEAERAVEVFDRAWLAFDRLAPGERSARKVVVALELMGDARLSLGHQRAALRCYLRAAEGRLRSDAAAEPIRQARLLARIGELQAALGDGEAAIASLLQALDGLDSKETEFAAACQRQCGELYAHQGAWQAAQDSYQRALDCHEPGPASAEARATSLEGLAEICGAQQDEIGRAVWLKQARAAREEVAADQRDRVAWADCLQSIAACAARQQLWQQAVDVYREALGARETMAGQSESLADILHGQGRAWIELGTLEAARSCLERACRLRAQVPARDWDWRTQGETYHSLGLVLGLQGDWPAALFAFLRAWEAFEGVPETRQHGCRTRLLADLARASSRTSPPDC